jgi:membrane fusion protein, copper/silver efflux system
MNKRRYIIYLLCLIFTWSCKDNSEKQVAKAGTYYTCSMHPQIMESKPGKCPICHMPLIEVKAEKAANPGEIKLSDEQIYLGNIRTDTLRSQALSEQLVLSGTVAANAELASEISARAMGRIEKLYVRSVGDYVRKGQVLYSLNSDDLNLAIKEYLLALDKKSSLSSTSIDVESLIESAKNKLGVLGLTNNQIELISKNEFKGNVVDILSHAEGIVTEITASEGAYLMVGSAVLSVAQFDKLWIIAQVYPQDLRAVMGASVAVASVEGVSPNSIKGKLTFVTPEYNTGAKISEVRMEINNDRNVLKPGMRANVNVITSSKSSPAVPVDAVIHGQEGATVWIRIDKNTFAIRMVQTGMESDGFIEIIHGLKQGEVIVTSGAYLINSEYLFRQGASPMEEHDMSNM